MKLAFSSDFEETLSRMKWPGRDLTLSEKLEKDWSIGVEKLLDLQEPYVNLILTQSYALLQFFEFFLWPKEDRNTYVARDH